VPIAAIAGCLIAGSIAASPAAAADRDGARSSVTIKSFPRGVFGYVRSSAPKPCAGGRHVTVFAKSRSAKGASRHRIGRTVARRLPGADRGHRFGWSLKTKRRPHLHARVAATQRCASAHSRGTAPSGAEDFPACPSPEGDVCRVGPLHFDTGICPSFTSYGGECDGDVSGPAHWNTETATLRWSVNGLPNDVRSVRLWNTRHSAAHPGWELYGLVPGPGSGDWGVSDAWNKYCCPHYQSGINGPRDTPFGPIYWDFENGIIGADVYVKGYLHRKAS
jgi:hypothetical protein